MVAYLDAKGVKCTSLDPVHMGYAGESSPPAIIWVGVVPGSLSAEEGVEVATHLKAILSAHGIDDIHIEIREAEVIRSAGPKMYQPVPATIHPYRRGPGALLHCPRPPICAE